MKIGKYDVAQTGKAFMVPLTILLVVNILVVGDTGLTRLLAILTAVSLFMQCLEKR